jgi:hypothetical protein
MMNTRDYVIGRGKLYFDKFIPGTTTPTGERYLGNSPSVNVTSTYQDLPHYTSDYAVREMDDNFTLQTDRAGTFTVDNASIENVGLLFGSDATPESVTAATAQTATLTDVKLGYYYQIGTSVDTPDGVTNVTNVTVTQGVTRLLRTATTLSISTMGASTFLRMRPTSPRATISLSPMT